MQAGLSNSLPKNRIWKEYGKGKIQTSHLRDLAGTIPSKWSTSTWALTSHVDILHPDRMSRGHTASTEFIQKHHNPSLTHKKPNVTQTERQSYNAYPTLLKTGKVMKNKKNESLHRPEKTKETRWLNAMWDPGLNSATDQEYEWKSWWNQCKVCNLVNNNVLKFISQFWQCYNSYMRY